ncbi:hypothetical protein C2845_PM15G18430 [Panicum miliaceum]|uniref:Non-structural maintenance of chromosomes element 4 n=1 Tax=Panicum miliaceum TaxID=4540 RepID=A0A3L6QAU3_PANMI|nr:hypothetical protein C2845_PM15G18430 [Panicum miliaceum]
MEYRAFDSSGESRLLGRFAVRLMPISARTDDELPPTYKFRGPREHFSGIGRSLAGTLSQPGPHSNLDSDIHQMEQQAYTGVLRAFKMQSDALTWEKESLITELRRELKVSDEEHRVLLNKVNEEEAVHRIRQSRQGCGMQSSLHHNSVIAHNLVPLKRQKKSHPVPVYSLPVGPQSPIMPLHAVAGNKADTVGLMAPENIRWGSAYQTLPNQVGWLSSDGAMPGTGRRSERFYENGYHASPNGISLFNSNHIDVPNTGNLVKKVERVLSRPDVYAIQKAKKLLIDQEQSLLDAIAKLDEASDSESELKDDPALGKFYAAMDTIEKLHEEVQKPLEQLVDGEALLELADVLVSSTKAENRDGPTPSEFVTALLRKFGVTATPLDDSNEPFSWSSLGGAASTLFMTATGCQTMHGPMGLAIKERRHVFRRESGRLDSRPAEPDALAPDQDERNDTDKNMAVMFDLLVHHKSVKLEHLILNRQSFAQTVENIFALSFLVKDGRAEINVVDSGDHFVAPRNAPAAGLIASRKVTNSQFVFRFDTEDWQFPAISHPYNSASCIDIPSVGVDVLPCSAHSQIMQRVVKPGEEVMPHRSSYHGGEYRNTQSCPARDCTELGSDSEHLKEDKFAKEDPVEFTNDEAVKENLINWCSEDDTMKKRKRQHVARRLFSADD